MGADTAVYGISTILGRFLTFLLVPFYTNVLNPGDYGIVTYIYSLIAFVNVIYSYGMETAYFKYASSREIGTDRENYSTPFYSLAGTSLIFSAFVALAAQPAVSVLGLAQEHVVLLYYSAGILACDAIAIIPFASLRLARKSKTFAFVKLSNIAINVAMNIYLLVVVRMGIEGIFISGLVSAMATLVILVPLSRSKFSHHFHLPLWKALLRYGLPTIPAGLAAMAVQVIDRPILKIFVNDAAVGIYQANYKLGIFMMLVVSMFDYAWRPFYFSVAKEPDAKAIFSRVLTYFVLFMAFVFLILTFFIGDIVQLKFFGRSLIHPMYWSGLNIVPIVMLGYLFLGVSTTISAGIYIEKKTSLTMISTFVAAGVNILANVLLIPRVGITGAAWATLLAYFAMALTVFIIVQKIYPIKYEFGRLSIIGISLLIVFVLFAILQPGAMQSGMSRDGTIVKLALITFFCISMFVLRFFSAGEKQFIKKMLSRFLS